MVSLDLFMPLLHVVGYSTYRQFDILPTSCYHPSVFLCMAFHLAVSTVHVSTSPSSTQAVFLCPANSLLSISPLIVARMMLSCLLFQWQYFDNLHRLMIWSVPRDPCFLVYQSFHIFICWFSILSRWFKAFCTTPTIPHFKSCRCLLITFLECPAFWSLECNTLSMFAINCFSDHNYCLSFSVCQLVVMWLVLQWWVVCLCLLCCCSLWL